MPDTVKAYFKSLTKEKNPLRAVVKILGRAIGYFSTVYAFTVLLRELELTGKFVQLFRSRVLLIALCCLAVSWVVDREPLKAFSMMGNSDVKIGFVVSDIFCIRSAKSIIIPTNTFFRTNMEGEYISPESVQGKFQNKYFRGRLNNLNDMLSESLQNTTYIESSDKFGKTRQYPIGTVAKIDYKKKHYFFVAICNVNAEGKPVEQSLHNVDLALKGIQQAIEEKGYCDDLCLPLIGAGKAAISDATVETVFKRIVDWARISTNSETKLCKKLIICLWPRDYLEGRANIERLKKYLDYRCEF